MRCAFGEFDLAVANQAVTLTPVAAEGEELELEPAAEARLGRNCCKSDWSDA